MVQVGKTSSKQQDTNLQIIRNSVQVILLQSKFTIIPEEKAISHLLKQASKCRKMKDLIESSQVSAAHLDPIKTLMTNFIKRQHRRTNHSFSLDKNSGNLIKKNMEHFRVMPSIMKIQDIQENKLILVMMMRFPPA